MEIKTKLLEMTWLNSAFIPHGYGCGYIGLPPEHPWHGKNYMELEVDIHGGLTYSNKSVGKDPADGYWWIGFDTAHSGDNMITCNEQYCINQIEQLKQQALNAYIKGKLKT
jgi:hypothetical protein